jgi:polysaccharide pyruvyl transferase WcaK-like protein
MAVVTIDTRLDTNATGLRTSTEVESLIARMEVVVTTRLHGTVFALKNAVPVIAIDPIVGGAKIRRQAETIGWPIVFTADGLTDEALRQAFDFCLTEAARVKARECGERAAKMVEEVRSNFMLAVAESCN